MSPRITSDALAALSEAGFSRRDFLKRSGALIVTFSAAGVAADLGLGSGTAAAEGLNGAPSPQLDSWIAIANRARSDGVVHKPAAASSG